MIVEGMYRGELKPQKSPPSTRWWWTIKNTVPGVIFRTDFSAGVKMTMGQAIKHKRRYRRARIPGLVYRRASQLAGEWYHGLYLELKREGVRLMKKDGSWANEHFAEQHAYMKRLERARLSMCLRGEGSMMQRPNRQIYEYDRLQRKTKTNTKRSNFSRTTLERIGGQKCPPYMLVLY